MLPPISTLSAALASTQNVPIAPELMGEEGMPPTHLTPGNNQNEIDDDQRRVSVGGNGPSEYDAGPPPTSSHSSYGGFANSAAREEDRGWVMSNAYTKDPSGRSAHPWEEGYRELGFSSQAFDDPHQQQQQQQQLPQQTLEDEMPRPPRKRSRVSKPRQSRGGGDGKDDILDGMADVEYEDPMQDPKAGPIFVHPPQGAAQACVRCHRIKRKCDNARPRCAGCSKADVACVFELSPATSSYVQNLKSDNATLSTQIASAAERIAHLESVISSIERGGPAQHQTPVFSSGQNDDNAFYHNPSLASPRADFPALAKNILSIRNSNLAPVFGQISVDPSIHADRRPSDLSSPNTPMRSHPSSPSPPFPPYQVAHDAVEAFFICNAISYPFLDKGEFLRDMEEAYSRASRPSGSQWHGGQTSEESEVIQGKEFVMFMVIAIGTTNRERMGELERGSSRVFRDRAMGGLQVATGREDILCVQALILLGIYSMFDPSGISLWHVVGFAARISVALNLHRRVEDGSLPANVVEQRKRVFYSLYNLDRLVATTLSRPLAISDDDIDVELPSALPSDSPYRGVPRIAYTQHIIKLRRLSGLILSTVYSVSGSQNSLTEVQRAEIITDLHSRLDAWLAECPEPPPEVEEKRGMINNHSWFLLNYHHCLCLLYRPSPLYPNMTTERLRALHEASTRCVDLYLELWHEQKISYNLINVSCQFLACISLLYCLCEYDNRSPHLAQDEGWRREVSYRVSQCHELLEAFGRALPETAKYREIFGKLSEMLLSRHGPLAPTTTSSSAATGPGNYALPTSSTTTTAPVLPTQSTVNLHSMTIPAPPLPTEGETSTYGGNEGMNGSGEAAWKAMTGLWHSSGGFQFDESVLGQIHDERFAVGSDGQTGGGVPQTGQGKVMSGGGGNGTSVQGHSYGDIGMMLWNQVG